MVLMPAKKRRFTLGAIFILFLVTLGLSPSALADENWPREIKTSKAVIHLYQPQPEAFKGNTLKARAAIGITLENRKDPVFGAVWLTARVETDRSAGIVHIVDISVDNIRLPEAGGDQTGRLKKLLETEIPKWALDVSLEGLTATLAAAEKEGTAAQNLSTKPPHILFSEEPAVLLMYDGAPQLRKIDNSSMMRVINTPLPVILESSSKTYYLSGGDIWYRAKDAMGPWEPVKNPPAAVSKLVPEKADTRLSAGAGDESATPPTIIVATQPTELLVSDGKPTFSPIAGTGLLYMANSESDILLEISTQKHFVLLAGRWFESRSLEGDWKYVPADKLPADFKKIPPKSVNGHLLAFVGGTQQAKDMVLDNHIPQTATVKRGKADIEVVYDGAPQFKKIKGTAMAYAVNTPFSVLGIDGRYYLCHDGIWYVSNQATGPWEVATQVPDDVQAIPADNPNYHVKYVYVYGSTPEVVYVGYTPAYLGSYVYGPCVVYGTGYVYTAWWGPVYYYPRPCTWGLHVRYNPVAGWCFGFSYASGPFRMTVGVGGAYWGGYGPGRFRPYPYRSYRKTNVEINRNININTGDLRIGGDRAGAIRNEVNVYRFNDNRSRLADRKVPENCVRPEKIQNKPNNVFTDKSGKIHRRTDNGWESLDNGKWPERKPDLKKPDNRPSSEILNKRPLPKQKPAPSISVPRSTSRPQLERAHQARQHSRSRTSQARSIRGGRRR